MYNDPNAQPPYGEQTPYPDPYAQQYNPYPQPQYPQTQYGTQPPPVYIPVPQPQKSSAKTVWIVLGIIGAILLLVGGGCCAALYLGVLQVGKTAQNLGAKFEATTTAIQQTAVAGESTPEQQASAYYSSISLQDYSVAFDSLAPNLKAPDGTPLTLTKYTQEAQQLDTSKGLVTNFNTSTDPANPAAVTVQVTRSNGKTYAVHLTFTQGDFEWVISSFDGI